MYKVLEKNGISNLVSITALIVSVFAFMGSCEANRPSIQIKELPVFRTSAGKGGYFSLIRILVANSGGRAVSLNTISLAKGVGPVMGIKSNDPKGNVRSISVTGRYRAVKFYRIENWDNNIPTFAFDNSYTNQLFEVGDYVLNKKIEPGETLQVNIGLEYPVRNDDIDTLLISLDANFSDGTAMPIRVEIDAGFPRRRM